jgi:hypothetical protein
MVDIGSGESLTAEKVPSATPWSQQSAPREVKFNFPLKPHSYRVFRVE